MCREAAWHSWRILTRRSCDGTNTLCSWNEMAPVAAANSRDEPAKASTLARPSCTAPSLQSMPTDVPVGPTRTAAAATSTPQPDPTSRNLRPRTTPSSNAKQGYRQFASRPMRGRNKCSVQLKRSSRSRQHGEHKRKGSQYHPELTMNVYIYGGRRFKFCPLLFVICGVFPKPNHVYVWTKVRGGGEHRWPA